MSIEQVGNSDIMYLSIIGWTFVQKAEDTTPWAKKREYETSDWKTGVKWEIPYKNLSGKLSKMMFKDSDYGEQFVLELVDGKETYHITMWTDSRYFADFAKKLPNINLAEDFELNPFDFKTKEGKQLRWMSIKQDWTKVESYYWDAEKKKTLHKMPEVSKEDAKGYDKDDWKMFFIKVKKFLKAEVEKVELEEITAEVVDEVFADETVPF